MSALESAVRAALPSLPALKDVDEPVLDYLSGLVGSENTIKNPAHLSHVLAELLVSYDVCTDEKAAATICQQLFDKLVQAGVCKTPVAKKTTAAAAGGPGKAAASASAIAATSAVATPASSNAPSARGVIAPQGYRWIVATEKLRARIQVGVEVLGRSPRDGKWHPARVDGTSAADGGFVLLFPDCDRATHSVDLRSIKVLEKIPYLDAEVERELREGGWKAGEADRLSEWDGAAAAADSENPFASQQGAFVIRKLKEAVVIGEFGITQAEREDAELDARLRQERQERTRILTKREVKERKREALALKREIARAKAQEAKKFEALKRYLAAPKSGMPTDVEVKGVSLGTPDGGQELLSDAELRFVTGRRYGLIGRNGVGKCWERRTPV